MAFDYSGLEAVADDLIGEFGRTVTFRVRAATLKTAGEPWLGKVAAASAGTAPAAFIEYNASEIDGSIIQAEDRKVLVAAKNLGFSPTTAYEMVDGSVVWQVVRVAEIRPGATALAYELQVRA